MCHVYPRRLAPGAGSEQRSLGNERWAELNRIGLLEERDPVSWDTEPWRAFSAASLRAQGLAIGMFKQGLWINKGVNI